MMVWLELARGHSALGAALAVWVGGKLAGAEWELWWLLPMGVAFLLSAAGNAFNDAHDGPIDAINRPKRAIPRGAATPRQAKRLAYLSALLAFALALPFGLVSTLGTLLSIVLLFLYTTHLKAIPLLGNAIVGLLTGMALGYGGLLAGNVPETVLPAATLGILFGARELLKTIHDLPGDKAYEVPTIATLIGAQMTLLAATISFIIALTLLTIWSLTHPNTFVVLLLTTLTSLLTLIPLWVAPEEPNTVSWSLRWSKGVGLVLLIGFSVV
jgi:4-hydroxybenzoate polyprenyltransferase